MGRDGTVHLPQDVLHLLPPGTLVGVEPQPDGTVLLVPARSQAFEASGTFSPFGSEGV